MCVRFFCSLSILNLDEIFSDIVCFFDVRIADDCRTLPWIGASRELRSLRVKRPAMVQSHQQASSLQEGRDKSRVERICFNDFELNYSTWFDFI